MCPTPRAATREPSFDERAAAASLASQRRRAVLSEHAAALATLELTYCHRADAVAAEWRLRGVRALDAPLSAAEADAFLVETLAWLDEMRHPREPRRYDEWIWRAIRESRNALLRRSSSAEPLRRFERAIAAHAPTRVTDTCVPDEHEAAAAAVLRYLFELAREVPRAVIVVPHADCVAVQTLSGPLVVAPEAPPGSPSVIVVDGPSERELEGVELPWPDAPTRWYWMVSSSGLWETGHIFVVQRVDGLWRVVLEQADWSS